MRPCGPVLAAVWHILAILATGMPITTDIGPFLANPYVRNGGVPIIYNIGLSSLGKTIGRHYGNLYVW